MSTTNQPAKRTQGAVSRFLNVAIIAANAIDASTEYDGERCIEQLPELLSAMEHVGEWCDLIEQSHPEMRFTKSVRAILAKCKKETKP